MYALINHTSENAKDVVFGVYYNDIMYELHSIEINGTHYDLVYGISSIHAMVLFDYMRSRINVWSEIKNFERQNHDEYYF
jgi:predicted transposase YdaD